MKHLQIPFEQKATITIKQGSTLIVKFEAELATSPIEQFQALLYRTELKENSGVAFIIENPALPAYINTKVPFEVDTIQFDEKGEITHIGNLQPAKSPGIFITAFQTKHLFMIPLEFSKKHKLISVNESKNKRQQPFIVAISNLWNA
ncbi:MAG: DUF192 domain-containing protein [Bacteroidetes bacterium]|nr:DUF192 domain-containing protein [Bacteroidota bacterium]